MKPTLKYNVKVRAFVVDDKSRLFACRMFKVNMPSVLHK